MRILTLLFPLHALWAGQSINLTPNQGTASSPQRTLNQNLRHEFQVHSFTATGSSKYLYYDGGDGLQAVITATAIEISDNVGEAPSGSCSVTIAGRTNLLFRVQRNVTSSSFDCEVWNVDGSGYELDQIPITSPAAATLSGITFGDSGATAKLAWMRKYTTTVALGGQPPTTYTADSTHSWWKFDSSLADSSGNARTVTWTSPSYSTTPDQGAAAVVKTYGAPTWTEWLPFRAGHDGQLDGTSSFSMADTSNTVTYFWQQLSGPSTVTWSSRTASQPTVSGLVFGSYVFQVTVTDADGSVATDTLSMGAVATDTNGIVVQSNADADKIFGPMIGLGNNPWRYQDYQAMQATSLRSAVYATSLPPSWATWKTGTVSYKRSGTSPLSTTLNGGINATDTTIVLTDASGFDWSTLPTLIQFGTYTGEFVRICNRSGNTLTVCFDGRGWGNTGAVSHSNGVAVYQTKMTGSGTSFLTTLCPNGAGPGGATYYATGTVTATASSTTLEGSGTTWTSAMVSRAIVISGTYSTGTPFRFIATISSVTDADTLVLSRAYPAGADTASGLSYKIYGDAWYVAPEWTHPTIATGGATPLQSSTLMMAVMCETDTTAYTYLWIEATGSTSESGRQYAVVTKIFPSDFGLSYYDEGLAHLALYLRSGSQLAYDTAKLLIRWWVWYPGFGGGVTPPRPRQASIISAFADVVLFPDSYNAENWKILRGFASTGATYASNNNCYDDFREAAYAMSWTALAALFDPDAGSNATWVTSVGTAYTRDNGCKGTNYASPQYAFPETALASSLTVNSGSATVTGSGIPASLCNGAVVGTITLANGSATGTLASGGPFQSSKLLTVWGARPGGVPWVLTGYTWGGGSTITLETVFEGSNGTYSFQLSDIDSNGWNYMSFLNAAVAPTADPEFGKIYSCVWVNSGQITLDRNWEGSTITGTVKAGRLNLIGFGQQPFMSGIKTLQAEYANQVNSSYQAFLDGTAEYIWTTGYFAATKGLYYGVEFPPCVPQWDALYGCSYNSTTDFGKTESRIVAGEAQNAARVYYEANTNNTVKTQLDETYGGIWGDVDYNTGGVYYDSVNAIQAGGYSFASYKWTGFLFGVGMSHQWPAARLGGVAPEDLRTYSYGFTLPSGADKIQLTVMRPSGETVSPTSCTTSPCTFTYDARQGKHLVKHEYQTTGGATRGISDWREVQ